MKPDNDEDTVLAAVHRFRECVAVSVGDGSTTLFTVDEAKRLARAISKVAKAIPKIDFVDSKVGSIRIFRNPLARR